MIDYAEDDIPKDIIKSIENKINTLKKKLTKIKEASKNRDGFFTGYKVCIIGKPNVGKSSLLNKLLMYDRAIVSDVEGTTRDTIQESVSIGSHTIKLVDTAGIRDSSDKIESIGIEYSKKSVEEADIIIALFDLSSKIDDNDRAIIDIISKKVKQKPVIVALNKLDLNQELKLGLLRDFDHIKISCKKDITPLKNELKKILDGFCNSNEQILISKRQIQQVEYTINALESSFAPLKREELEIFSFFINEAITFISEISNPYQYDEMLDSMFGNFCLGK
jgi:tRNA modification GTPase